MASFPFYWIGLMSGTSLDGVDVALISTTVDAIALVDTCFVPYSNTLKDQLLSLHTPKHNELEQSALMSNRLSVLFAKAVNILLERNTLSPSDIQAIGNHGQTIRHCPKLHDGIGFTLQLGNHALLAELTGITVVADFRSRDIAAGGQGAPLVPTFHQQVFGSKLINRAIVNIGGIANITYLPSNDEVMGFDSGPGNMLMDDWSRLNTGQPYDKNGQWAATGKINAALLQKMLADPFFGQAPPKSTGRDLFNANWLQQQLQGTLANPADVARTLTQLTAVSIHQALNRFCPDVNEVYLCGGGAHNQCLFNALAELLSSISLAKTDALGIDVDWVEAIAFAWLAKQTLENKPANLPAVTGAKGLRVLGAIYPA